MKLPVRVDYDPFEWYLENGLLQDGDEEDGKICRKSIELEMIEPLTAEFKGIIEVVEDWNFVEDDGIRYLIDKRHTPRS
jgi:hypothetical protein